MANTTAFIARLATELTRTDESFFRHVIRMSPNSTELIRLYVNMRIEMFGLLTAMMNTPDPLEEPPQMGISIVFPPNWDEPVPVVATAEQINSSLIDFQEGAGNCTICQDPSTAEMCMLRSCNHPFHRSCISQWFRTSSRCPVCRNDIRETSA